MIAEPFAFSEPVKRAMAQRDPVATGVELLEMNVGFRALWVDETKRPYTNLTPRAVHDATSDPRVLQEWAWLMPDSGLAVVLPDGLACIDRDDSNVIVDGIPRGTWGERTRRGEHHLVTVPAPLSRKCRLPGAAGDFITGSGSYVVLAPSHNRWPFDIEAHILPLAPESPLWRAVVARGSERTRHRFTVSISAWEHDATLKRAVDTLESSLVSGRYADTVNAILEGRWAERYPSRSEADCALAFMATHFTRDSDIIAALLAKHSAKARELTHPEPYIALTTAAALEAREQADRNRVEDLYSLLSNKGGTRGGLYDVTPRPGLPDLRDAIVRFASISGEDAYARDAGWRRLPVADFAVLYGVHRQTVWRRVRALADTGLVEYDAPCAQADKGPRKDTLIRPAGSILTR